MNKDGTMDTTGRIASHHRAIGVLLAVGALLVGLAQAGPARADFGLQTFTTTLSGGGAAAGAHPDLDVTIELNQEPATVLEGSLKDFEIELPPGFVGDPGAIPECTMGQVMSGQAGNPCPLDSAVGSVRVTTGFPGFPGFTNVVQSLVYNVQPYRNQPAAFGFNAAFNARLDAEVRSDGDYGITVRSSNITEVVSILKVEMTLWGVPADHNGPGAEFDMNSQRSYGGPGGGMRRPFLTNATACSGAPQPVVATVTSWQDKTRPVRVETSMPALEGCDALTFEPEVSARPDTTAPGAPAGYTVDLDVPQQESPNGRATPHLKDAVVTLPEGVTLSPSVANGLTACSSSLVGIGTRDAPQCPDSSKIGRLSITTPVLEDPLVGDAYIGEPLPGNRYRLFLVVEGAGVRVKLEGRITPDQQTGQITARFIDNPQLPFSNMHLEFNGGPRAPLANPTTCGVKTTTSELTSWAGHTVTPSDSFEITGCQPRGFAPTWSVGTINPVAGADTAFTMRVTRTDNDHEIDSISADLPPGLLGRISRVPLCSSAQAAAATCPESSRIGSTTVGAGPGSSPFYLKGRVYLTEGYKGAPYGMAFVVPAIAGPYDLGIVNVRAGITVDRITAEIAVGSDPLPRILDGIPLRIKDIRIDIDRPGFMVNPTSCASMQVLGRVTSQVPNHGVDVGNRFQVGECASLPLEPELDMTLDGKGETRDGDHPALKAVLRQTPGQTNLRNADVTLPLSLALDPDNAQALCKPEQAAARACPPGSIVGSATAVTPVLTRPLTGPVYFVEGIRRTRTGAIRRTLPKLWIPLRGEVELDLNASTDVVDDKLVTSFAQIPDAPISSFELNIAGGKNGVIVVSNADVCAGNQQATGDYTGQSGKVLKEKAAQITPLNCPTRIAKVAQSGTSLKLTVGGLRMGGRVSVSGDGVQTTRRTLKTANAATLKVPLTDSARRQLVRNKRLEVKLAVAYTPTGERKAKRMSKTVTLKYPVSSSAASERTGIRRR